MKFTGKLQNVSKDWSTGQYHITFTVNEPSVLNQVSSLKDIEKLEVEAKKYRKSRSNDANKMLWACLNELAKAQTPPIGNWEMYLMMLKRYGKYTYICVKPNVVDAVRAQWRETEVIGEIDINGKEAVQMLCYFGSSTYDTKEFSDLLEGVIYEMEQVGLQPPPSKEMKRALEQWGKMHENSITD
jgi:hypothetical protein